MEDGEEIVVVGQRKPKPAPEPALMGDWGGSGYQPAYFPSQPEWMAGLLGAEVAKKVLMFEEGGNRVFRFTEFGFDLKMPLAEWNALTADQKKAIVHVLENYGQSSDLTAAMQHLKSEGISGIELRYGSLPKNQDGTNATWGDANGQPAAAQIDYDPDPRDPSLRDIPLGTKVVISFNAGHAATASADGFAEVLIHELLHPYVPDTTQANGSFGDHDEIWRLTPLIQKDLGGTLSAIQTALGGVGFLGSRYADNDVGTTSNDTMAGMGGNDVLNGMGGNDVIAGGAGMDTMIAGAGSSYLYGGLDADTYVGAVVNANFMLEDAGGVDRLKIAGSASDFVVSRNGDNLSLWSPNQGYAYEIIDHYVDGKRIEVFEFNDAEYSASYMEYLADTTGGPGVCYQDGYPVVCGSYGMPIVIDLKGDGVRFVDADKSKVWMDVNGDGDAERIGWTQKGDDAFLVLDRNGNGTIDSFSEMSFLTDFRGAGSDLEGLLAYDTNRDGFLTAADEQFDRFQIWQDMNGDGVSQPRELLSLTDLGIVSIGLEISGIAKLDQTLTENQVLGRSTVIFSDGSRADAHDVALYFEKDEACGCHLDRGFVSPSGYDRGLMPTIDVLI